LYCPGGECGRHAARPWFLFKGAAITKEEISDYDPATFDEIKSPSQRLRAVMFVVWKEVKGGQGDFESFYRAQVERIIEQYKEKLPTYSGGGAL
jgi:hypothetical protein